MIVECHTCGSDVERKPAKVKASEHNFCDKSCAGKFYATDYSEAEEYGDDIRRLYWDEGLSVRQVADALDKAKSTIDLYMRKLDIPRRERLEATGDGVGMYTERRGYEILYATDSDGTAKSRVHTLVKIADGADPHQLFGGVDGEVVHHKNGVPWDNRPENLETMTQAEHAKHHDSLGVS